MFFSTCTFKCDAYQIVSFTASSKQLSHELVLACSCGTPIVGIDSQTMIHVAELAPLEHIAQVRHHQWIYGPNFGMVDVLLSKGSGRPDITREFLKRSFIVVVVVVTSLLP